MIYSNIELNIKKGEVIANNTLCLYRGDKNVEVRFILKDNHFVIQQNTLAQLIIKRPNANSIFSDISQIQDNTVVFLITGDMINELNETGYYDIQIRLFDDNRNARVTLPPVMSALEIRNPLIDDSVVGTATVGYATVMASNEEEDTFLQDGSYNATNWANGDIISAEKLNKVEDALSIINDKVPSIDGLATVDYVNQEISTIELTPGPQGPQGPQGPKGEEVDLTNYATKEYVDQVTTSSLTLGIHTDGLIYIFQNNTPVGVGVEVSSSGDVVGYVDENNVITLSSGVLEDGLYTLRYSNASGYKEIGTLFVGEIVVTRITATKIQTLYEVGADFTTNDITVTAYYNDGTSEIVTSYTVNSSAVKMDEGGTYQLVITCGGCTTNIPIIVTEGAIITGNLFVPSTCSIGKRINSSGQEKDQNYTILTDYIEIGECMATEEENVIHWQGFNLYHIPATEVIEQGLEGDALGSTYRGVAYYDSTGKYLGQDSLYSVSREYDSEGNYKHTLNNAYSTATKIRVWGIPFPLVTSVNELQNCKLTLNQLISEI